MGTKVADRGQKGLEGVSKETTEAHLTWRDQELARVEHSDRRAEAPPLESSQPESSPPPPVASFGKDQHPDPSTLRKARHAPLAFVLRTLLRKSGPSEPETYEQAREILRKERLRHGISKAEMGALYGMTEAEWESLEPHQQDPMWPYFLELLWRDFKINAKRLMPRNLQLLRYMQAIPTVLRDFVRHTFSFVVGVLVRLTGVLGKLWTALGSRGIPLHAVLVGVGAGVTVAAYVMGGHVVLAPRAALAALPASRVPYALTRRVEHTPTLEPLKVISPPAVTCAPENAVAFYSSNSLPEALADAATTATRVAKSPPRKTESLNSRAGAQAPRMSQGDLALLSEFQRASRKPQATSEEPSQDIRKSFSNHRGS